MATSAKDILFSQISTRLIFFLERMREMGYERNIPNISWNTADFLIHTLQKCSIKNILEIGPANGFSTMMFALACPKAHITSIECSRHAFEELRHNIATFSTLLHD
jgi:predicted O-methyltransferase YrrM